MNGPKRKNRADRTRRDRGGADSQTPQATWGGKGCSMEEKTARKKKRSSIENERGFKGLEGLLYHLRYGGKGKARVEAGRGKPV